VICQYNENTFPEDTLLGALYTHPKVIIYGVLYDNPFFIPPEYFEKRKNQEYFPATYQQARDKIIALTT